MRARLGFWLLLVPSLARANGAMGLGLEMWDLNFWWGYVLVTVAMEAWIVHRALGVGGWNCVIVSVLANTVTGGLCAGGGCLAPLLHQSFVGRATDPNPFLNSVVLLLAFAIPSAFGEWLLWQRFVVDGGGGKLLKTLLIAHVVTIPIGLGILLIPENPYRGFGGSVEMERRRQMWEVEKVLSTYLAEKERIPTAKTPKELAMELGSPELVDDIIFYAPDYDRFSQRDKRGKPYQVNLNIAGKRIPDERMEEFNVVIPYITRTDHGMIRGIFLDCSSLRFTYQRVHESNSAIRWSFPVPTTR